MHLTPAQRARELEALQIDPSTGIDYASDVLNPAPPPN
jgi:hypothetical protein